MAQAKQTTPSQLNSLVFTQAKLQTPPRPVLPLTAAFTALSYSLSEAEFSADGEGDEVSPEGSHILQMVPQKIFTTPGRPVHISPSQRALSVQPGVRTAKTTKNHAVTCADLPCFPGVQCEVTVDGGFRCGRCPVGYIGNGLTCRGTTQSEESFKRFSSQVVTFKNTQLNWCLWLKLFVGMRVGETWCVLHLMCADVNQATLGLIASQVNQHLFLWYFAFCLFVSECKFRFCFLSKPYVTPSVFMEVFVLHLVFVCVHLVFMERHVKKVSPD